MTSSPPPRTGWLVSFQGGVSEATGAFITISTWETEAAGRLPCARSWATPRQARRARTSGEVGRHLRGHLVGLSTDGLIAARVNARGRPRGGRCCRSIHRPPRHQPTSCLYAFNTEAGMRPRTATSWPCSRAHSRIEAFLTRFECGGCERLPAGASPTATAGAASTSSADEGGEGVVELAAFSSESSTS